VGASLRHMDIGGAAGAGSDTPEYGPVRAVRTHFRQPPRGWEWLLAGVRRRGKADAAAEAAPGATQPVATANPSHRILVPPPPATGNGPGHRIPGTRCHGTGPLMPGLPSRLFAQTSQSITARSRHPLPRGEAGAYGVRGTRCHAVRTRQPSADAASGAGAAGATAWWTVSPRRRQRAASSSRDRGHSQGATEVVGPPLGKEGGGGTNDPKI